MPEMDGPTLLKELRKRNPELKIIFVSGYAEDAFEKSLPENERPNFLAKPFTLKQLVAAVKETMAGNEMKVHLPAPFSFLVDRRGFGPGEIAHHSFRGGRILQRGRTRMAETLPGVEMSGGKGPTTSTPGSVMISLMKVRPMSTSPLASISMAPLPPWAILILGFMASAMPSFCSVSLKLTPAAVLGLRYLDRKSSRPLSPRAAAA